MLESSGLFKKAQGMKKKYFLTLTTAIFLVATALMIKGCAKNNWQSSSRESANIAPLPAEHPGAIVQIFAAKLWGWRGLFADHTWVATKAKDGDFYTVYEVIGWRLYRGNSALRIAQDIPDRRWYGAEPKVLLDIRGDNATALVKKINQAAAAYPYPDTYQAFPGPNSNTFTAWIIHSIDDISLELPFRAIGKDYPLNKVDS